MKLTWRPTVVLAHLTLEKALAVSEKLTAVGLEHKAFSYEARSTKDLDEGGNPKPSTYRKWKIAVHDTDFEACYRKGERLCKDLGIL